LLARRGKCRWPTKRHPGTDTTGTPSLGRRMFKLSRRTVAALAASFGGFAVPGIVVPNPAAADNKEVAQVVRAEGFVIVFRHCATLPNQTDTDPLNYDVSAAQRNLNDKGKVLAKAFGDAIREIGIPVGKVYTSKCNRAYETSDIADFRDIDQTADLAEGGLVATSITNRRAVHVCQNHTRQA
jgi:Histidine phosphatase superfamily (branch 1)